jgi:hypothetical protein
MERASGSRRHQINLHLMRSSNRQITVFEGVYTGFLRKPRTLFLKGYDFLVKPKILADGPSKIIFALQIVNVAPQGEREIVDVFDGGRL